MHPNHITGKIEAGKAESITEIPTPLDQVRIADFRPASQEPFTPSKAQSDKIDPQSTARFRHFLR
jgi:hypothetical protein